jgi:hypothetical protein
MNRFPAIANREDIRLESTPVAGFTGGIDIFKEIHLEFLDAAPLTSLAPASGGIEGEVAWGKAAPERIALRSEEGTNFIKRFQVGDWIRARRSADRFLIDEPDAGQMFDSLYRAKLAHRQ